MRNHLDRHLQALPPGSESRAILQAMRENDTRHGRNAIAARAMTATTYRF